VAVTILYSIQIHTMKDFSTWAPRPNSIHDSLPVVIREFGRVLRENDFDSGLRSTHHTQEIIDADTRFVVLCLLQPPYLSGANSRDQG